MLNADRSTNLSPAQIFAPFALEQTSAIVAAVSGGSDSLALLFLLRDYLATLNNPPKLIAVTVDHRLRAESTEEAENVGHLCRRLMITHRILSWTEPKPEHGVAAAAREARYRLLIKAAREENADFILTGHTQNDQIETYLMRKARSHNTQSRGLAVMASRVTLERSVQLIRPLLSVTRQSLRDYLNAKNIQWVDDPSNINTAYERPRVRIAATEEHPETILQEIVQARAARERDNDTLIKILDNPASLWRDEGDQLHIDPEIFAKLPETARHLFAGILAAFAGGRRFLPGEAERIRIAQCLISDEPFVRLTQSGALIERGNKGKPHRFRRERRNLPVIDLGAGTTIIWDGRYRLTNAGSSALSIAAADSRDIAAFLKRSNRETDPALRRALTVSPAIYQNGELLSLPVLETAESTTKISLTPHFALFDHVLPGHDEALAAAFKRRIEHS